MEEMDLEEWELLPRSTNNNHGFNSMDLDHGDEDDGVIRKIIQPKKKNPNPNPRDVLDMDYFICPSQDPPKQTEPHRRRSRVVPTHLVQVPITWEPIFSTDDTDHEIMKKPPEKLSVIVPESILKNPNLGFLDPGPGHDPDLFPSPQVSFKKMKETEFVDMKIDQPRTSSPLPQTDKKPFDSDGGFEDRKIGSEGEKLNLWKLSLTGIGAICSFGVAAVAATICIVFLGNNNNKNDNSYKNKNQLLRFQIYTDDKRMKEVVHHATKLNEAISVMKGVPAARAQISFGGYYDGL